MHGLAFPEATEDHPWGHSALKVRGKTFVWLDRDESGGFSMTVKLPISRDFAETFDWAEPAGYGLARSGWITCRLPPDVAPDIDLLKSWIAQSYRAVALKKLAKALPH
jgi:predicted DNA-binding protein (MmcQ/YjbR family)